MSILRWTAIFFMSFFPLASLANPLASPEMAVAKPLHMDVSDTEFCRKARYERESSIAKEADLLKEKYNSRQTDDLIMCFSPDENLLFLANQEAQKILGPHAPWYIKISEEFRVRVEEACNILGFENNERSRAYDQCVESRFEELMGPYQSRYQRESSSYINKRRQVAESLIVRCDAALSVKRSQLPSEIRFPIAYYDQGAHSVPQWLLEEKIDDDQWLINMNKFKVSDIMHDVLGNDCPGHMVKWVTYGGPGS